MTEMVMLFLKYPLWVGEQAVTAAKRESPQFVPSVPLVERCCEEAVSQTREAMDYAQQWEHRAQLQLAQRAQIEREDQTESLEYRRAVVARLWPSGLIPERATTRDIGKIPEPPQKQGFRQFSDDDLRNLYPCQAAE